MQRYISTLSLNSALDGVGGQRHGPLYSRERDPVRIVQMAGLAPGPVWSDAKNLVPNGMTIKLRLENTRREKSTSQ